MLSGSVTREDLTVAGRVKVVTEKYGTLGLRWVFCSRTCHRSGSCEEHRVGRSNFILNGPSQVYLLIQETVLQPPELPHEARHPPSSQVAAASGRMNSAVFPEVLAFLDSG